MNFDFNKGILQIELPKIIDPNNANVVEEALKLMPNLKDAKEVTMNAENLVYISSLGLRAILKFLKAYKGKPVTIFNVSPEVYEIFNQTGFTSLLKVVKKFRKVDVEGMELIGAGMYGAVYRINAEQILKIFYGIDSELEILPVIETIRTAFIHDIPTIIPFEIVRTEKGIGIILELLNSEMMSTLMNKNPEKFDKYVSDMVTLIKTLSQTVLDEGTLRSRKEMLLSKLDNAETFLTAEEIATIKNYINVVPDRNTAVHGDLHAKNIMIMNDRPVLIDMDEFSCGHPVWDIGNFYFIYYLLPHLEPKIAEDLLGIAGKMPYPDFYKQIIAFTFAEAADIWDKFFNEYFADYSSEEKKLILEIVDFYGTFKFVTFLIDGCNGSKDNAKIANNVKHIRRFLAKLEKKNIENLIKSLDILK